MVVDIILPLIISLLPGGLLLLVARIRLDIVEWLFLSSAMSIVILTVVGVVTQDVLPLTVTTIGAAYLVFFVILLRTKHHLCPGSSRKIAVPEIRATHLLMIIPLALSFMAWRTAYGISSIDMGWHAFWAQQVSNTGLLPNYSIIEPFDQASRFVYGPHLLLGTFSILTGRTTDTIFWMPLAIFSTASIGGIYAIANRLSRYPYAGLLGAILYSISSSPGGYIQRGNLSDVLGFFLLLALIYILLLRPPDWKSIALGSSLYFTSFAFHPYAVIVASAILLLRILVWTWVRRERVIAAIKTSPWSRPLLRGVPTGAAVTPIILPPLGFLNSRSGDQIRGIFYDVPNAQQFASTLASTTGVLVIALGLSGFVFLLHQKTIRRFVPLSWLAVLAALVYAPLWGIGLEPVRFIWRIVEPLSVMGGTFLAACWSKTKTFEVWLPSRLRLPIKSFRPRTILIVGVILFLAIAPQVVISNTTFEVVQPNMRSDVVIGRWLAQNGNLTGRVAVDAEYDNTATWIMYYSNYPLFLYRVNFAVNVAPYPYRRVFNDLRNIFENPTSSSMHYYLTAYDIQYLVTSVPDKSLFYQSPYLRLVMTADSVSVFKTLIITQ